MAEKSTAEMLGSIASKTRKKTLKMLLGINKYIHTCIHFLKVLTP